MFEAAELGSRIVKDEDHGSQYLSDHFLKQIRYWGIHPSFGFVEEPETNGVAERWNRTLKEQAIHGRVLQNLEDVRAVRAAFVERYNQTWRLEKLGLLPVCPLGGQRHANVDLPRSRRRGFCGGPLFGTKPH